MKKMLIEILKKHFLDYPQILHFQVIQVVLDFHQFQVVQNLHLCHQHL